MVSIARKNLFHDRLRLAITLLGIAFAVMLMLAQCGVYLGFVSSASQLIDHCDADLWVTAPNIANFDSAKPIPERRENAVRALPGVLWSRKLAQAWGLIKLRNGGTESVQILGFDPESGTGGPWDLITGSLLDVKTDRGVIIDESSLARLGHPQIGDRLEVFDLRVKIVGICRGAKSFTTYPILFTSYDTARHFSRIMGEGQTTFIVAKMKPGFPVEDAVERLRGMAGVDVYTQDAFSEKTRRYWTIQTGMGMGIGLMVLLGFLVGTVVVGQTIYASTMEHLREFGTYKAIGATNRDVYAVILEQALWSALMGYGGGLLLTLVARRGYDAAGLICLLPAPLLVIMFFITLLMCVVSSVISIRKAAGVDPVIVFRG